MTNQYRAVTWDAETEDHLRQLVRLAVREDLSRWHDWTTLALVSANATATAEIIARQQGVVAGIPAIAVILDEMEADVMVTPHRVDGAGLTPGQSLATMAGQARAILTAERIVLNVLGRLCGIATQTRLFVETLAGTKATVYDTRKTTPGMRRLEKYAVGCGGGHNHREGLFDGILIKDNHLAFFATAQGLTVTPETRTPLTGAAVEQTRRFLEESDAKSKCGELVLEIENDTLDQLRDVLAHHPDVVLLDNMSLDELRHAVQLRDAQAPHVILEASGGVRLETVRAIAETGVDRISVGALTHSVPAFDVGLDWGEI
ncbi:MAG: carboxylating nicotinate-nucleotide diphosphorylase [Planctomycetales bacterium]|nr:carboxylating nicotinate-nucleotide diphosphorylase [Planctomycetales bacterium]